MANRANGALTEDVVIAARRRHANGESIESMIGDYGVSYETLRRAVKGMTWTWVTDEGYEERKAEENRVKKQAQDDLEAFMALNEHLVTKEGD